MLLLVGHLRWNSLGVDHLLKHVDHVEELTVDVANDDDRLLDAEHIRLVSYIHMWVTHGRAR